VPKTAQKQVDTLLLQFPDKVAIKVLGMRLAEKPEGRSVLALEIRETVVGLLFVVSVGEFGFEGESCIGGFESGGFAFGCLREESGVGFSVVRER
jgi:hypothetical protein